MYHRKLVLVQVNELDIRLEVYTIKCILLDRDYVPFSLANKENAYFNVLSCGSLFPKCFVN